MFDSSKLSRRTLAFTVIVAGVVGAPAAQGASGPKIKAMPKSVMVNQSTILTGRGFPANSTILLRECSATSWIVPQEPCLSPGEEVTTNAAGAFKSSFTVGLCPAPPLPPGKPVTRRKCFIGEPKPFGEDQVELVGAAKIIVTFP
jgi:hypothetical protein